MARTLMSPMVFENKITFGNIIVIVTTTIGLIAAYTALAGNVAFSFEAVKAIPSIESRVSTIETRINIGQAARESFQVKTETTLEKLQNQNTVMLAQLSAIIARMDEAEKRR